MSDEIGIKTNMRYKFHQLLREAIGKGKMDMEKFLKTTKHDNVLSAEIETALGIDYQGFHKIKEKGALTTANQNLYETAARLTYDDSVGATNVVAYQSDITSGFQFKGVINCSANPNFPAANAGDLYKISVAGKIGGASGDDVEVGDSIYCTTDSTVAGTKAAVGAYWVIVQEGSKSYDTDVTLAADSDAKIATQHATKTYADGKIPKVVTPVNGNFASVLTGGTVGDSGNKDSDYMRSTGKAGYRLIDGVGGTLAVATDYWVDVDCDGASRVIYAPTAVGNAGKPFVVRKLDSGASRVEVTGFIGGQTIGGEASVYLYSQNECVMIWSDGANYQVFRPYIKIPAGTPVNAVASSKALGFTGLALNNESVTIGGQVYKFQSAIAVSGVKAYGNLNVDGVPGDLGTITIGTAGIAKVYRWRTNMAGIKASGNLNVDGVPGDRETVTIGTLANSKIYRWRTSFTGAKASKVLTFSNVALNTETAKVETGLTYTYKTALTEAKAACVLTFSDVALTTEGVDGDEIDAYTFKTALTEVKATGTLTAAANFTDGETVTIGTPGATSKTYKFEVALSSPAVANEVKIGASASDTLDNLIAAINGAAGVGVTYSTGTVAHTEVDALAGGGDTMTATAKTIGVWGNAIATAQSSAAGTWGDVTLLTGADAIANEVVIGNQAQCCDRLVAAMMGTAGEGTTYSTGTTHITGWVATSNGSSTVTMTHDVIGVIGNGATFTDTLTNAAWGNAGVTAGGVDAIANEIVIGTTEQCIDRLVAASMGTSGEGTTYSTGTTHVTTVACTKVSATEFKSEALTNGYAGNLIEIAETLTNAVWTGGATALSGGNDNEVANDVLIEVSATLSIDNLVSAITDDAGLGTGEGTKYGTGTVAHSEVTATNTDGANMGCEALTLGTAGNLIATTESGGNTEWDDTTLLLGEDIAVANDVLIGTAEQCIDNLISAITYDSGIGTNEGTKYGTGTVAHTEVTATKTDAANMRCEALAYGEAGNLITTTEVSTNITWDAATLLNGEEAEQAYDVLIGVSAEACIDNLVKAITDSGTEGTHYGIGTVAHPTVTAVKTNASTMTATAKTKGVAGDLIALAEDLTNGEWLAGAAFLSGGVNGTLGRAGEKRFDTTYEYLCVADNTIADANWTRKANGSAY